ncbi:MAG: hypothetical protein NTZ67_03980 [Gammaproteobacteria bacterium]|nr:hypothetical protein [Gammaproteobacteria bacterium]
MRRQTELHQVVLTRPNGSQISTIRTQAIGTQSKRIDNDQDKAGALAILMRVLLTGLSNTRTPGDQSKNIPSVPYFMPREIWLLILSFNLIPGATYLKSSIPAGIRASNTPYIEPIEKLGAVAITLRKPSLFPVMKNSDAVIEAVLHGDEEMVLKMVQADPQCLTRSGTAIDLQGNPFTGTPLQTALRTTDIEMCEKMKPYFAQIEEGEAEMHRQIKEIYTQSLNRYLEIQHSALQEQEAKQLELLQSPTDLDAAQENQHQEIVKRIKQATKRIITYKDALETNDIHKIIGAHDQAQEDNAFNFQAYVEAICNAKQAELDDAINLVNAGPTETADARQKPFDQLTLTLVEKLNRFREKFVIHAQQEIIFNPHHILTGQKHNEKTWDEVDASPSYFNWPKTQ